MGTWRKRQSAGEGGGDEAGQIADHAAADGRHDASSDRRPVRAPVHRPAATSSDLLPRRLDDDHVDLAACFDERIGQRFAIERVDVRVGDDDGVSVFAIGLAKPRGGSEIAAADLNVVNCGPRLTWTVA